jgi:hypothetical protein
VLFVLAKYKLTDLPKITSLSCGLGFGGLIAGVDIT